MLGKTPANDPPVFPVKTSPLTPSFSANSPSWSRFLLLPDVEIMIKKSFYSPIAENSRRNISSKAKSFPIAEVLE